MFLVSLSLLEKCQTTDRWSDGQQKTSCEKKKGKKKRITILHKIKLTQDVEKKSK